MNLKRKIVGTYAIFSSAFFLKTATFADPVSTPAPSAAPRIQWRIVKAETYTFWEKWDRRMVRGVKIEIFSPGYLPTLDAVIPDDVDQPAHWQLTDAEGHPYVRDYTGESLDDGNLATRSATHVIELTGVYLPIPSAKVGQIRLKFPIAFDKINNAQGEVATIVQCDTIVTHHK